MAQHNIKFIATDMDGTLLDNEGRLPPDFFDVFQQLEQKDIMFAAASGRQYYSLLQTFSSVKERMIFIAENGTLVMHKGEELYSCTIDTSSIHRIIKEARLIEGAHIVLCGKKSAYIETQIPEALNEIKKYYHRCEFVKDLLEVEDEFIKIAICHFDGSQEHVYPSINEKFSIDHKVVVSAKVWLDVMNINASKGDAITYLQDTLKFSFEQTMSFGDYFNDIEMLQASFHSYAVENAHEKVKKYARFSAPSNLNHGVLNVIKEHLQLIESD
ncbi:Cof-type HAD-IIB family hydrolase [Psychromonas sp. SR45-3]|uniref:Cof-type HAD-IIB family hydrolase n=1 Tax=Psychromonas sp. SR45-3 TaxID=2760930 RepID=UPI0015FBEE8D|nr:Cof-type HAD-IIB family hydrolase [Psychromonas sp. SR45-3]MBB1272157.1 HAD family hydrolase [Psychromonas sp. SR45-3]